MKAVKSMNDALRSFIGWRDSFIGNYVSPDCNHVIEDGVLQPSSSSSIMQ